jgi:hypothetical protein
MILVYSKRGDGIAQVLTMRLGVRSGRSLVTGYSHIDDVERRLRLPRLDLQIVVLDVDRVADLDRFVSLKELFADLRLILILPDDQPQTLTKAHRLSPRFVTHADATTATLVPVLEKMMGCVVDSAPPHTRIPVNGRRKAGSRP